MEVDPKALAQAVAAELDVNEEKKRLRVQKDAEVGIVLEPIRAAFMDLSVAISAQTNGRVLLTEDFRWSDNRGWVNFSWKVEVPNVGHPSVLTFWMSPDHKAVSLGSKEFAVTDVGQLCAAVTEYIVSVVRGDQP